MIQLFLKAKHWQLFIIMLGIPLISQVYFLTRIFRIQTPMEQLSGSEGYTKVVSEKFILFDFFPFITIFFILIFFGWFWSIAIGLQQSIPNGIKMKVRKFKILFFIPLVYIVLMMVFMSRFSPEILPSEFSISGYIFAIILPLHLLSMFCIFYSMYFAAKTFKTAELQRKVEFGDFAGEFFLLWFYFIGIWIIQPKVNKLYEKEKTTSYIE